MRAHPLVHEERVLEVPCCLVKAPRDAGEKTERTRRRAEARTSPTRARVSARKGVQLSVERFGSGDIAEEHAHLGEKRHGVEPEAVFAAAPKVAGDDRLELRAGIRLFTQLEPCDQQQDRKSTRLN